MGQGKGLATFTDPLAQCEGIGSQTSDRELWETYARRGQRNLEHAEEESNSIIIAAAKRILSETAT